MSMPPKRIQRRRTKGFKLPVGAVSVTRPGKWGNEFKVLGPGLSYVFRQALLLTGEYFTTAEQAVARFRVRVLARLHVDPEYLAPLRGKDLACWCPADAEHCHADVLLELANK